MTFEVVFDAPLCITSHGLSKPHPARHQNACNEEGSTMTWRPSEGIKRAEPIVGQFHEELTAAGIKMEPVYQWRLVGLIARALDDALGEKSDQDALAAMVKGNGHVEDFSVSELPTAASGWTRDPDGFIPASSPLATADPVGLDMPDFPADNLVPIVRDEPPPPVSFETPFDAPAPKKRGRPKGSTNKAKKKAKAAKKATSLTDIPNAEAEPPAGEAA